MHDIGVKCLFFVYAVDIGYETLDNHTHARTHTHNNYWKKERKNNYIKKYWKLSPKDTPPDSFIMHAYQN